MDDSCENIPPATIPSVDVHVCGLQVKFPFPPYPSQRAVMSRVLQGLTKKQNCLIESPTGSGKSLSLLCSCLAWQQREKVIYEQKVLAAVQLKAKEKVEQRKADKATSKKEACKTSATLEPAVPGPHLAVQDFSAEAPAGDSKGCSISISSSDSEDDFQPSKRQRRSTSGASLGKVLKSMTNTEKKDELTTERQGERTLECCGAQEAASPVAPSEKTTCTDKEELQRVPLIYYGTRTHKQIAQVVRELRKTVYGSVRMAILSSRDRTCIHPQISKMSNRNEHCKELLEDKGCAFHSRVKKFEDFPTLYHNGMIEPYDLEDLVSIGKRLRVCPYFWTLDLIPRCDIVFCPYNYLIDPIIRKCLSINLSNSVVVLDEAHNIEDSCRESISLSITQDQIREMIRDLEEMQRQGVSPDEHFAVAKVMSALSVWITRHSDHLNDYRNFDLSGKVLAGKEILALLTEVGLGEQAFPVIKRIVTAITTVEKDTDEYVPTLLASTSSTLQNIVLILEYLYVDSKKYMDDFRAALVKTVSKKKHFESRNGWLSKDNFSSNSWTHTLSFWCLNPAVAMSDIKRMTHSLIVASGTLWPMDSFESELDTAFPLKLQTGHVISNDSVWVGSLSTGPSGQQLTATFKNTEILSFQDEVGSTVLDVCKIVPYGVLCFFPSYGMMTKLVQRWKNTGLWDEMCEYKVVVAEPQRTEEGSFDATMQEYYDGASGKALGCTQNGALLLAVCRGKVSEGLDFADNSARAVITVGIPFPSIKDIQVDQKKKYNDQCNKMGRPVMSGHTWYETQGFRALNQALGRCIRHSSDWGALVVIDHRFTERESYRKGLSKWIREKLCRYWTYNDAMTSLRKFIELKVEGQNKIDLVQKPDCSTQMPALKCRSSVTSSAGDRFACATESEGQCCGSSVVSGDVKLGRLSSRSVEPIDVDDNATIRPIYVDTERSVEPIDVNDNATVSPVYVDTEVGAELVVAEKTMSVDGYVSVVSESSCSSPELF
ncbi:Fanconi anemia group J protein-like isoform X2 [Ornithodoros turicata]|uniref:Fanconi anemia group J protein-like isoform X2 n=1 Tax=Ornithodoros turicata TaxID=34597 RepID=UPI0031392BE9